MDVVEEHFPELLQEQRELTPEFLTSRGLLRQGRSLEHYELVRQHSSKIVESEYCGSKVAIKGMSRSPSRVGLGCRQG